MTGIPIISRRCLVIAEAGVNHNGNIDMAKRLIDAAAAAGADAVKFQTFHAEDVVTAAAKKAGYQKRNTRNSAESQLSMLKKLELKDGDFRSLKRYCDRAKIIFLSTPFDIKSVDLLETLVPFYKISSGEITNCALLESVAAKGKPVVLSTGMATVKEIADALRVLDTAKPGIEVILLHCTTNYPCPFEEVNLKAMLTLKEVFGLNVGYSDHTTGIEVPIAAVALGARIIEKHFTLDRSLPGPDHKASLEPDELKTMIRSIKNIERALGDGIKKPTKSELKIKDAVRRSLVAKRDIEAGHRINKKDIAIKRPGDGIAPCFINSITGMVARAGLKKDGVFQWALLRRSENERKN